MLTLTRIGIGIGIGDHKRLIDMGRHLNGEIDGGMAGLGGVFVRAIPIPTMENGGRQI